TGCVGLALFAAAQGTAWLFGARVVQGLAVGLVSGPATAALVEYEGGGESQHPALLAGLAQAGGSGLGAALAGVLAQWAPAPRQLSFLLVLAATMAAAAVTSTLPEPAAARARAARARAGGARRRLAAPLAGAAARRGGLGGSGPRLRLPERAGRAQRHRAPRAARGGDVGVHRLHLPRRRHVGDRQRR